MMNRRNRRVTLRWFIIALMAVMVLVSACGDRPVPEHGTVTDAKFTPAWMQWMPGVTTCNGTPPMCTTSPGYPIFWPDKWRLTITDLKNSDWVGTVEVSPTVFDRCNLRELWPDCSETDSGDVRKK